MVYSEFIKHLPLADVPFPGVDGYMLRSDDGLTVFFHFKQAIEVPPHSHGAQWGIVVKGAFEMTIGGVTRQLSPGNSYVIGRGEVHSASIPAGTWLIDVFEEPDRYKPRGA